MRIFHPLVSTLGLVLFVIGCAQPYRASVDRKATHPAGGLESLVIETDNGSVTLETDPLLTEISVEARVTGSGDSDDEARARAEAATVQFEPIDGGRGARFFVTFPEKRRASEGCSLVVRSPKFFSTRIETGNGDVRVVATAGDLDIHTSNGSVTVDQHVGTATIDTSNGNLRLLGVSGDVVAKSSNGSIVLDAGAGSIAKFDLDTSNGAVEIALGDAFSGSIDAATSNGSVDCRLSGAEVTGGRTEKTVRVGDGARSRVRTSNGSIVLR